MSFVEDLAAHRLLGIVRGRDPDACIATALALVDEGVRLLEVSLTSTSAFEVLAAVADALPPGVSLGAGTVLTASQVDTALDHGATFVVTPGIAPSVERAVDLEAPVLCGALTPTEVIHALDHGVDAVKIFPADAGGPAYLSALRAPFPEVPFVAVGGIGAEAAPAYLKRGAVAVGVASPMCGDAPDGGDMDALRTRARHLVAVLAR